MNKFVLSTILVSCLILTNVSMAQRVPVDIFIDTSFGNGGKAEINIGGFNNEMTGFFVDRLLRTTTVCGKINIATSGIYHFAMARVDSLGKSDPGFGNAGIVNYSWSESDYPNAMQPHTDNSGRLVLAGAGRINGSFIPAIYRILKTGIPDSSFGINGRLIMPFADQSSGEAVSIAIASTEYIISGKSTANDASGITGFGAMTIHWDGTFDSTFGTNGRVVLSDLVHSVQGFFLNDRRIFFCGISDTGKRELVVARLLETGVPDTTLGPNGIFHTGILLAGDTLFAQQEFSDNKIVILLPTPSATPTHITICRYDRFARPDSSYAKNGISTNDIIPAFQPKGLFIGNDNSQTVSGMTGGSSGHSIFVRINDTSARPDPTFNRNGITSIDIDSGIFPNYLTSVEPTGKVNESGSIKRFIGVGSSLHNGIQYFMIAQFIGLPPDDVPENASLQNPALQIYPNPVSSLFHAGAGSLGIKKIRVVDALGREVLRLGSGNSGEATTFSGDASGIPDGVYYCIAQTSNGQSIRKFVVTH